MKRILVLIMVSFLLFGCSSNSPSQTAADSNAVTPAVNEDSDIGQDKEVQIEDAGISLVIPGTWSPEKYKIYKENNVIWVKYIDGATNIPFFYISPYGKKSGESPKVGVQMAVVPVDDWVFIVAYSHGIGVENAPSDYNSMAEDAQEIATNVKITDKSKLEQWYKEYNTNNTSSQQTTDKFIINERSNGQDGAFYIGMPIDDVKNSMKNLGATNIGVIEITNYSDAPNYGNKDIPTGKYNFEFDKNDKLYQICVYDNTPTSLGLKNGDSKEQMEKLYGNSYKVSQGESSTCYEYELGNKIFDVMIENGIITEWRVSDKETKRLYEKPASCISSKDLIGLWNASPEAPSGNAEAYFFSYSNDYRFIPAEGDNSKKEESGMWYIQNGKLNLRCNCNNRAIEIGLLEDATENAAYKYKVKIDGRYFWKISGDPELN
ncbi:MAG: hypothetical protein ABRQ25_09895 [Clostridiaceae bacterium]